MKKQQILSSVAEVMWFFYYYFFFNEATVEPLLLRIMILIENHEGTGHSKDQEAGMDDKFMASWHK